MAEKRGFRFYLADLVMASLLCGLFLALFISEAMNLSSDVQHMPGG